MAARRFRNIDGGLRGWCAVLGSWLFQFSMIGTVVAFGSYQTYYEQRWLKAYSESSISWIGSIQLFLEFFIGVLGGWLLDGGRWRLAVTGGSMLFLLTFFILSLCHQGQYAPIFLSQGLGMGSGLGLAFLPISGIVANHFTRRRSLAMGIITTGTSLGGFVFSILANKLLDTSLGFAWTVRVSAFICLGCIMLGNLLLSQPRKDKLIVAASTPSVAAGKTDSEPTSLKNESEMSSDDAKKLHGSEGGNEREAKGGEGEPRTIRQLLRDPAYLAIISSGFFNGLGLYVPSFIIKSFALEHGISPEIADWLLSIINLCGVLGRTVPNWLADHYGMLELYVPCTAVAGGLVIFLGAATSPSAIIAFSVLYEFFSGSIVSLYFPSVYALDPHVGSTGTRLGIACLPVAFASLVGSPIAQAAIGREARWWNGIAFAGAVELLSAVLLAFAWFVERGREKGEQRR